MEIKNTLYGLKHEETAINFLLDKLILFIPTYTTCDSPMLPITCHPSLYRCNRSNNNIRCEKRISIFTNTIFESKQLSIFEIFYIMNNWRSEVATVVTASDLAVAQSTVSEWYNKFTKVVLSDMVNYRRQRIGGFEIIVELDECLLVKHKYNRGRVLRNQAWIFAGVERGNNNHCFIEIVQNRKRATLLEVLNRRVRSGI